MTQTRPETDLLGTRDVPDALYGIHTLRWRIDNCRERLRVVNPGHPDAVPGLTPGARPQSPTPNP